MKHFAASCAACLVLGFASVTSAAAPDEIPGLKAWFSADMNVTRTPDNKVTQWQSRVGNYTATQTTADKQPVATTVDTSGRPILEFDGTDDNLRVSGLNSAWNTEFTFFLVTSSETQNARYFIDSKSGVSNNRGVYLRTNSGGSLETEFYDHKVVDGTTVRTGKRTSMAFPAGTPGSPVVIMARTTSAGIVTLRIADTTTTKDHAHAITNISGTTEFTIGSNTGQTDGSYLDGGIQSLLIYDRALTDTEAQQVYDALYNSQVIPEPGSMALSSGLLALLLVRRRGATESI